MSSLQCPCGHVLHDVEEARWRQFASFVLTPSELEEYEAAVRLDDDEPTLRELWRCVCGRIAVDTSASGMLVQWYVPIEVPP